jgi:hypothetical protein
MTTTRTRLATYFAFGWIALMGGLLFMNAEDRAPAASDEAATTIQLNQDAFSEE